MAADQDELGRLIDLSRLLGDPRLDYAILAEGNTSVSTAESMVIKASGSRLDTATEADFVHVEINPLMELIESDEADQNDLSAALRANNSAGDQRRASIETLMHVLSVRVGGARWVGHVHPTALVSLLSTPDPAAYFTGPLFPDEAVVCGPTPLLVPYADPGLPLARVFRDRIRSFVSVTGGAPKTILLANHGLVALGQTAEEVEAVTAMAVKAAKVRAGALAAGGVNPLPTESIGALFDRDDEKFRRELLYGQSQTSDISNAS